MRRIVWPADPSDQRSLLDNGAASVSGRCRNSGPCRHCEGGRQDWDSGNRLPGRLLLHRLEGVEVGGILWGLAQRRGVIR